MFPYPDATAERLQGSVERVTFYSPESGFCVLRVKVRGQRELVTVVGSAASITPGEYVECAGAWISGVNYLGRSATIILAGLLSLFFRVKVSDVVGWLLAPRGGCRGLADARGSDNYPPTRLVAHPEGAGSGQTSPVMVPEDGAVVVADGGIVVAAGAVIVAASAVTWPRASLRR